MPDSPQETPKGGAMILRVLDYMAWQDDVDPEKVVCLDCRGGYGHERECIVPPAEAELAALLAEREKDKTAIRDVEAALHCYRRSADEWRQRAEAAEADTKRGRERRRALNQYEAGDFLTADEYFRGLRQRINDRFPEDAARADAPTPEVP